MTYLYETTAINEDGVNGESFIKDGERVTVSTPLSDEPGTNPEQLIGLAMSTCFNATVQTILKADGLTPKTRTETAVKMFKEPSGVGYYFDLDVQLAIEGLADEKVANYLELTKARCPIAKLTSSSDTVSFRTVKF